MYAHESQQKQALLTLYGYWNCKVWHKNTLHSRKGQVNMFPTMHMHIFLIGLLIGEEVITHRALLTSQPQGAEFTITS